MYMQSTTLSGGRNKYCWELRRGWEQGQTWPPRERGSGWPMGQGDSASIGSLEKGWHSLRPPPFCPSSFFWGGPHPRHMEVPRPGLNLNYSSWPTPQPQPRRICAVFIIYTMAHWARPGIKPTSSCILVGFINHWATTGTPCPSCISVHFLSFQMRVEILFPIPLSMRKLHLHLISPDSQEKTKKQPRSCGSVVNESD